MSAQLRHFQTDSNSKYLLFAEGRFGPSTSKTANLIIRYQPEKVAAVIDSRYAGELSSSILRDTVTDVPIVASIEEGLKHEPTHCIIGVAPSGGQLPQEWRDEIKVAITSGLHVVSGLHQYLAEETELRNIASESGSELIDLRNPPDFSLLSEGSWRERNIPVVMSIGSDSAVGKLTGAWELKRQLEKRGHSVGFVATGQTGILINGSGLVIDAIRGDFMSAAVEMLIDYQAEHQPDVIIVEGQGSIYHEAFSGVTMSLLHGTMPDSFLFMHRPGRQRNDYDFKLPPLRDMINDYEALIEWFKPVNTLGIALDTSQYDDDTAEGMCREVRHITGLDTTDLVRFPEDQAIDSMIKRLRL